MGQCSGVEGQEESVLREKHNARQGGQASKGKNKEGICSQNF